MSGTCERCKRPKPVIRKWYLPGEACFDDGEAPSSVCSAVAAARAAGREEGRVEERAAALSFVKLEGIGTHTSDPANEPDYWRGYHQATKDIYAWLKARGTKEPTHGG